APAAPEQPRPPRRDRLAQVAVRAPLSRPNAVSLRQIFYPDRRSHRPSPRDPGEEALATRRRAVGLLPQMMSAKLRSTRRKYKQPAANRATAHSAEMPAAGQSNGPPSIAARKLTITPCIGLSTIAARVRGPNWFRFWKKIA